MIRAGVGTCIIIYNIYIYNNNNNNRDVYHTKRMQRLTSVGWSLDNKYVLSGSDEMCIRLYQ